MSTQPSDMHPSDEQPPASRDITPQQAQYSRASKRRDKIVEEIQRNRRGEYAVPTWVLALILLLILAGYATLIIFG